MNALRSPPPSMSQGQDCERAGSLAAPDPKSPGVGEDVLDWPMSVVLREHYPSVKLRNAVTGSPLFETTRLGDVLTAPMGIVTFLEDCRSLPGCGEIQTARIRETLHAEYLRLHGEGK